MRRTMLEHLSLDVYLLKGKLERMLNCQKIVKSIGHPLSNNSGCKTSSVTPKSKLAGAFSNTVLLQKLEDAIVQLQDTKHCILWPKHLPAESVSFFNFHAAGKSDVSG